MKKENVEFLKELQRKLNTQDPCGQASPIFWVIRQKERVWEKDLEDDYDTVAYYHDGDICEIKEMQDILNLEEDMSNSLEGISGSDAWRKEEILSNFKTLKEELERTDIFTDIDPDILKDIFSNMYYADTKGEDWNEDNILYGHYEHVIAPNTMFLTLEAAQQHCRNNSYHYLDGRPYSMTAWRSPQVDKLLEILKTEDFDNSKEDEIDPKPIYIDRLGLQHLRSFILLHIIDGALFLKNLEEKGVSVWNDEVTTSMDSLGNESRFIICNSEQMTNEECEKTVRTLNILLDCNWEFKEKI